MTQYDLEMDGERYLPWSNDFLTGYEHIHRYLIAARYATNARVLDVASGEGYGTQMLAQVARSVVGIDINTATVAHARKYHGSHNTLFVQGDVEHFGLAPNSIDLAVSFETIEHIERHDSFLAMIKSALGAQGLLIISSPNRLTYSDEGHRNPFHKHELDRGELLDLLHLSFKHVLLYGQNMVTSSVIGLDHADHFIEAGESCHITMTDVDPARLSYPIDAESALPARYYVAICSDADLMPLPDDLLLDRRATLYYSLVPRIENLDAALHKAWDDSYNLSVRVEDAQQTSKNLAASTQNFSTTIDRALTELSGRDQIIFDLNGQLSKSDHALHELNLRLTERNQSLYLATRQLAERDHALQQLNTRLADRDQSLHLVNGQLAERDYALQQLNTQLAERDHTLHQLNIQLAEHDQLLHLANTQLVERDQLLHFVDRQLAEQAQLIHDLETRANERDQMVREMTTRLDEQNETNERLQNQLQEQVDHNQHMMALAMHYQTERDRASQELRSIHATRSWRLINRWWSLKERVLPPGSRRLYLYQLLRTSTGILLLGGPAAFFKQLRLWLSGHRRYDLPSVSSNSLPDPVPTLQAVSLPVTLTPVMDPGPVSNPPVENVVAAAITRPTGVPISELENILETYQISQAEALTILDWGTGLELAQQLPTYNVFSPLMPHLKTFPYLDNTIDVVVLVTDDAGLDGAARLKEAERAAIRAVIYSSQPTSVQSHWTVIEKQPAASDSVQQEALRKRDELPTASIVIPSFNHFDYTFACVKQLSATLPATSDFEIIVVDDASNEETRAQLGLLEALDDRVKVIRNTVNGGFIKVCNQGAAAATKDVVILLNNDTLPQPGWLPPLLQVLRDQDKAGAVGGKLIYPDHTLQEAGGVIFSDGSAWNFGKSFGADDPLFNYVREVDYCSGALLATWRWLYTQLGGLDTRYAPIYYDDSDYCLQVRNQGYHVYYQPASVVIHFEGVTNGTDAKASGTGQKRYQIVNKAKFVEKWQSVLAQQPDPLPEYNYENLCRLAVARPQVYS